MNSQNMAVLTNIIGAVESGGQIYGNRRYEAYAGPYTNSSKEVTCTLGWAQNYGNEGRKLCKMILEKDPAAFREADTANIESKLSVDWVVAKWAPTTSQKNALIAIITTDAGKECQDALFAELMEKYIKNAVEYGVTDVKAQMMWCEIEHLGGLSPTKRIFNRAAKPYTPDSIFVSLKKDQNDTSNNNQVGDKKFQSRHECCVKWIKQYAVEEGGTTVGCDKNIVIAIAKAENGYLEKKSNSQLDSKTANAGSGNYTKYWRDLADWGLGNYQAQYWCAGFIHWCFVKAYGLAAAKSLLLHAPYISCGTLASKSKAASQRYTSPQVGDVVVFWNGSRYSHTGLVYQVSDGYFYTIEGNTSGASGVVSNGGGVVAGKKYKISGTSHRFHRPNYAAVEPEGSSAPTVENEIIAAGQVHANNFSGCGLEIDGIRGTETKKAGIKVVQNAMNLDYNAGLEVDGVWGPKSSAALDGHYVKKGETQYMVTALEILFMLRGYECGGVESPGVFGDGLEETVTMYKGKKGWKVNGTAGEGTFISLMGVSA
jgi:hypothetical protein